MAPSKKANQQNSVETMKQGNVPAVFEPIAQFFEKKVRNIEKRKGKLESLKVLQREGKLTDVGQQQAVGKYDEVQATLVFASTIMQELLPVLLEISNSIEKMSVDREKEKTKLSKSAIRSVLDIQDLYEQLGDENVRSHFAAGTEDALKLTEEQFATIDKLYRISKPSRCDAEGNLKSRSDYKRCLDESVGSWYRLIQKVESKDKPGVMESGETKAMLESIGNCGFFDASRKKACEIAAPEVIKQVEPVSEVEAPMSEVQTTVVTTEPPPVENNDATKAVQADILGSLQGRAVNFVQDDFGNHMPSSLPTVSTGMMSVSAEMSYNGGFQNTYADLSSNLQPISLENNLQSFGSFNGHLIHEEANTSGPTNNGGNIFTPSSAPQGQFPAAESWADEAPEMFDKNMSANGSGDNFTEVRRGNMNHRYAGRQNDYGRGGGYRNEFSRGVNRGGRGFESRGFNRPYRQEYREEHNRQEGGGYYRGGGGRGFGGGGKDFNRGGPGNRGPRPQRGGFENRPPVFSSVNAK